VEREKGREREGKKERERERESVTGEPKRTSESGEQPVSREASG